MNYVFAQIPMLLIVAAALGALFEHWRLRRHYVDVTLEYHRLKENWQSWRKGFEEKLLERPEIDFTSLTAAVSAIRMPSTNVPDLGSLFTRLDAIEKALEQLKVAARAPDVSELAHPLAEIEKRVCSIQESKLDAACLLQMEHRLEQRLDELDRAMRVIQVRMYREASLASRQALSTNEDTVPSLSKLIVADDASPLRARGAIE
jgi:hypothetical protein